MRGVICDRVHLLFFVYLAVGLPNQRKQDDLEDPTLEATHINVIISKCVGERRRSDYLIGLCLKSNGNQAIV